MCICKVEPEDFRRKSSGATFRKKSQESVFLLLRNSETFYTHHVQVRGREKKWQKGSVRLVG